MTKADWYAKYREAILAKQREYRQRVKDTPAYKARKHRNYRAWYRAHREEVCAKVRK